MYTQFYDFKEKPFRLTPDPKFIFFSQQHQEALDHMLYGISQREGFMAIIGGIGTGKTTLCRALLNNIPGKDKVALILNPTLSSTDLLRALVQDLGVRPTYVESVASTPISSDDPEPILKFREEENPVPEKSPEYMKWVRNASKKELLDALNEFLLEQYRNGGSTIVIIDEAQNLSLDVMEQVRLLSNLETETQKLLQIIFVGQNELNAKLRKPQLKQLNQRISVRYELQPLSREETTTYIYHRLRIASSVPRVRFSRSALKLIHAYTQGYPRLINLLCDRSLLAGYNAQSDSIEAKHVKQSIKSLLGDDEQKPYFDMFMKLRLALAASILFFVAGTVFFFQSSNAGGRAWTNVWSTAVNAVTPPSRAPVLNPTPEPVKENIKVNEALNKLVGPEEQDVALEEVLEKPEPEVVVVTPQPVSEEIFRIQVSSWKKKSNAGKVITKLQKQGYTAYIRQSVVRGRDWFTVYLGPYDSFKEARENMQKLKKSGRKPILISQNKN